MLTITNSIDYQSRIYTPTNDTTDYVTELSGANHVPGDEIRWILQITLDGTLFYQNTGYTTDNFTDPDFQIDDTSSPNTVIVENQVNFPADLNNKLKTGDYVLNIKVASETDNYTFVHSESFSFTVTYSPVTPDITVAVDCAAPSFRVTDNTTFVVDSITPTISSRSIVITYPSNNADNATPDTFTTTDFFVSPFYIGVQQLDATASLSYAYTGHTITDVVTTHIDATVTCDAKLCELYCCAEKLYSQIRVAKTRNTPRYERLLIRFNQAMSFAQLHQIGEICGEGAYLDELVADIQELIGCGNCGCNDESVARRVVGTSVFSRTDLAVQNNDQTVSVDASTIRFSEDTVTDQGNGVALITPSVTAAQFSSLSTSVTTNTTNIANIGAGIVARVSVDIDAATFQGLNTTPVSIYTPTNNLFVLHSAVLTRSGLVGGTATSDINRLVIDTASGQQPILAGAVINSTNRLAQNEAIRFTPEASQAYVRNTAVRLRSTVAIGSDYDGAYQIHLFYSDVTV